jgi:hypothetical protein
LNEVAITFVVLAKQHEMIGAFRVRAFIFVIIRRDVDFAADDGFYATGGGLMEEIGGGKKISVVRDSDRRHLAARSLGGELANFASAIEKRIIRVKM